MKNILFCIYIVYNLFFPTLEPNYQAKYKLIYRPDSTNQNLVLDEYFLLFIKENKASYFASENFLKKDSINSLVNEGKLSVSNLISDPKLRFKTRFPQFIIKEYGQKSITSHELLASVLPCKYTVRTDLEWKVSSDRDTVSGYICTKATTRYAGRDYEAWFTPEIPVSDGPFIFGGLPGLIIKLNDTRNHYIFTLEQFGKYNGKITEMLTYRKQQPVELTHSDVFQRREEARKDPVTAISRLKGISFENINVKAPGSSEFVPFRESGPDRSWDNNPLELMLKK